MVLGQYGNGLRHLLIAFSFPNQRRALGDRCAQWSLRSEQTAYNHGGTEKLDMDDFLVDA